MEARRLTFLICALLLTLGARAYYRVVVDPWVLKAVAVNTAEQKKIEDKHNQRLDSISAKQKKIAVYTAAMASIKEIYKLTMQNVEGFGAESQYYKEIFSCATDIFTDIPQVLQAISRSPVKNYVLCLNELADVTIETEGLIHDFVDIVNNAKVTIPDIPAVRRYVPQRGGRFNMGEGDGYNLLDRYDRITLANSIYSRLYQIKYQMDAMVMMCQYCGWSDFFFALDPESWAAFFTGKSIVDDIICDWNGLTL